MEAGPERDLADRQVRESQQARGLEHHPVGDQLLRRAAGHLRQRAREGGRRHWTVRLPTADDVAAVRERIELADIAVESLDDGFLVRDPWHITVAFERAHQLEALGYLHMALQQPLKTNYGSAVKVLA